MLSSAPPSMSTRDNPLHVLSVFSTFAVGGPQMRFAALANHFGPALRHSIVAMDGNVAARDLLNPTLNADFPDPRIDAGNPAARLVRMIAFLRRLAPDRLVTSNWGTIEWAAARVVTRTPHIHMEDGFGPEERVTQLRRRVLARRLLLRGSDTIVPSRVLEKSARHIWRLPAGRVHYVPNGIDLARFSNAVPASPPPGEGRIIGTVAALRPEKNLSRLIRAFALVRRHMAARLVIVGDGKELPGLQALARAQGVDGSCFFAGHSNAPENWLAAFDVFALSSDTEQMPLSILEACATSLPVAATDVGDVRSMLSPDNQPFVVPLNDQALADALLALLTHSEAKAIGFQNHEKARAEFSQDRMFAAYAALVSGCFPQASNS